MQTEESVREPDAFRAPREPESFGGGIFRKCSNDVNCSRLEMKGSGRTSFGVPARRSESSQMFLPSFDDEKQVFDCALSIGVPALCGREEDNLSPVLEDSGSEMHKFRLQSITRLLRTDSDLHTAINSAEKTTEAEFSDGSVTRTCSDCKTDKTPLWRNGPNGPKSLCNACGIRFKKITKQRSSSNGESGTRKNSDEIDEAQARKEPGAGIAKSLSSSEEERHDCNGGQPQWIQQRETSYLIEEIIRQGRRRGGSSVDGLILRPG